MVDMTILARLPFCLGSAPTDYTRMFLIIMQYPYKHFCVALAWSFSLFCHKIWTILTQYTKTHDSCFISRWHAIRFYHYHINIWVTKIESSRNYMNEIKCFHGYWIFESYSEIISFWHFPVWNNLVKFESSFLDI